MRFLTVKRVLVATETPFLTVKKVLVVTKTRFLTTRSWQNAIKRRKENVEERKKTVQSLSLWLRICAATIIVTRFGGELTMALQRLNR